MVKKILVAFLSVALVLSGLYMVQKLVVPKYMDDVLEGAFTAEYYNETSDHQVIFIGDCEVYENFSPVEMWEKYGITSYIRGSAQQLIWQSYYLLEDALQYETPEVVVYNVQSLTHNTPQKEEYNRMTIDGMKWSHYKVECINASMLENENYLDYVFPLLRYHSRITDLTKSDITYFNRKRKVTHNGYYMRVDVIPYDEENALEEDKPEDTRFGENALAYLDKIRMLCEEKGIQLLLIKAPSLSPVWFDEYEEQVETYAEQYHLPYINYLELVDEIKLDYSTDTYDGGLHMNLSGARKLSKHMGKYLTENFSLRDLRDDRQYAEVWEEKVKFYNQMIEDQKKELETYGYLKSFGGEASKESASVVPEDEEELEEDMFAGFE
ncbi:MAG: SGNH/GDSL hydrolase family protein [Eubacterium sp.]|nr:SGNH/GDSL hydrolase family protein [Eubacterium sp.]